MGRESHNPDIHTGDGSGGSGSPEQPMLTVRCHGETDVVHAHLTTGEGEALTGNEIDVAFRFQTRKADAATGVVSLANRTTGAFIVEVSTAAKPIIELVHAARQDDNAAITDTTYSIRLVLDGYPVLAAEKRTFLVYSADGTLHRHHSLIPADVEV